MSHRWERLFWAAGACVLVVAAVSCGTDPVESPTADAGVDAGPGGPPAKVDKEVTIRANGGGEIELENLKLIIPPGAVTQDVTIGIGMLKDGAPQEYRPITALFSFSPPGFVFQRPATVQYTITGTETGRLAIFWRGNADKWDMLGTHVYSSKVTALVTNLQETFVTEVGAGPAELVTSCFVKDTTVCGKGCSTTCRGTTHAVCASQPDDETTCTVPPTCVCEPIPTTCDAPANEACGTAGCSSNCQDPNLSAAVCRTLPKPAEGECPPPPECICVPPGLYDRALAGELRGNGPTSCATDADCGTEGKCVEKACFYPLRPPDGDGGTPADGGSVACATDEECGGGKCIDLTCYASSGGGSGGGDGGGGSSSHCTVESDCMSGMACVDGYCVSRGGDGGSAGCSVDTDCGNGVCVNGQCSGGNTGGDGGSFVCTSNADCGSGICVNGQCGGGSSGGDGGFVCQTDAECGSGSCVDGACTGGSGGDGGSFVCTSSADCGGGACVNGQCSGGGNSGDGGFSGGGDGGFTGGGDGGSSSGGNGGGGCSVTCTSGATCVAGFCVTQQGGAYVTPACAADSDCPPGSNCQGGHCRHSRGGACVTGDFCFSGMICATGECAITCGPSSPCPTPPGMTLTCTDIGGGVSVCK